jgi:hypothetical protein
MSAGTLSVDQERFARTVAELTGLDPVLVRSWVGAESGWGVTKGSHNYLNVTNGGSSRGFAAYPSVDIAASRVAQLLNTSSYYAGIRSAIPAGGLAQAKAIAASPWDAGHYGGDGSRLTAVYAELAGTTPNIVLAGNPLDALPSIPNPLDLLDDIPNPLDLLTNPFGAAGDAVEAIGDFPSELAKKVVGPFVKGLTSMGLTLVFLVFALVLIGMGVSRLTGINAGDVVSGGGTAATVAGVAKLAAI